MDKAKIIREFCMELQSEGYERPVAIEVGWDYASALRDELSALVKYADHQSYHPNECLYNGVLLIAPRNFHWGRKQ